MKIYTNDLVKGHSDFKIKYLTFGLYTQVSDSGPLGPLVFLGTQERVRNSHCIIAISVRAIKVLLYIS